MFTEINAQVPQVLLFRTNFESGVTIVGNEIIGDDDADGPSSFDTDIPNYVSHLGEWTLQYEGINNTNSDPAIIIPDPTTGTYAGDNVLRICD